MHVVVESVVTSKGNPGSKAQTVGKENLRSRIVPYLEGVPSVTLCYKHVILHLPVNQKVWRYWG